jgi:hypothetical protein
MSSSSRLDLISRRPKKQEDVPHPVEESQALGCGSMLADEFLL